MNRIQKKNYYKITFELASPLAVGSGTNQYTDSDIIKDSNGRPYIPASAIAGVQRTLYDGADADVYFGKIQKETEEGVITSEEALDSRILFYDAKIREADVESFIVSKRDSVALDSYKAAKEGAKFDIEILEPGVTLITYMEENIFEDKDSVADKIAQQWLGGKIYFGAKTMRGYGAIKNVMVWKKKFDLTSMEDTKAWLAFDMYRDEPWQTECENVEAQKTDEYMISIGLKQAGGISIRRYTTQVAPKDEAAPDYEQLMVHTSTDVELPVIPGTTWAGAFRHRMMELLPSIEEDTYFGIVQKGKKQRSQIRFSESALVGAKPKILSRNSIDRFSAGTSNGALFTEKTYLGGTTVLKISFTKCPDEKVKKALAATIADLHNGFLAIGGLTAVGRGLFTVEQVNGIDVAANKSVYDAVLDSMKWEVR